MKIRIGTRGSSLARWQADWVANQLAANGVESEIILLKTLGDDHGRPIVTVGSQGVFTKAIQQALIDNEVDLAVHSLKDLPTEIVEGLSLVAVPSREVCGDVLIAKSASSLAELPSGARIGTGSLRRQAQLLSYRPDLLLEDIRGNVETRLEKLSVGELDAIILAEAGLRRLGLEQHITEVIAKEIMLPAVGQGALGLEARANDAIVASAVNMLDDPQSRYAVLAERAMLRGLRGGCLAPVGAWCRVESGTLRLDGVVLSQNGQRKINVSVGGACDHFDELGQLAARKLLAQGADELIDTARGG